MAKTRKSSRSTNDEFELETAEFRGEVTEALRQINLYQERDQKWKDGHTIFDENNFAMIHKELQEIKDRQNSILSWGATLGAISGFVFSFLKDRFRL